MTALLIDSGVDTVAALVGLLPPVIAATVDHDTLTEADFASSLRMLATIKNPGWHRHVRTYRIDWSALLMWARTEFITTNTLPNVLNRDDQGRLRRKMVVMKIEAWIADHP